MTDPADTTDTLDTADIEAVLRAAGRDRHAPILLPEDSPCEPNHYASRAVLPAVEPFDAAPDAALLLGVLSKPPAAWRETLRAAVESGDLTSTARAGMDEARRALLHADTAAELLGRNHHGA